MQKTEKVTMKISASAITGQLKKNAELIGLAYGFMADPMYNGRGFNEAIDFITDRLSKWKPQTLLKPKYLIDFYKGNPPYIDTAKTAAMLYILGIAAEAVGQGKYKKLLQDVGVGMFKGSLIALAAFSPAANPTGATGSNFQNAPAIGAYGY